MRYLAIIAAFLTAMGASPAQATTPDEFHKANAAIVSEQARGGAFTPTFETPIFGPFLRSALDVKVLDQLEWNVASLDTCRPSDDLVSAYLGKYAALGKPSAPPTTRAELIVFHDEAAHAMSFSVMCTSRMAAVVQDYWNALPPSGRTDGVRQGAAMVRDGTGGLVAAAMMTQLAPGDFFTEVDKQMVLDAVAAAVPAFAPMLQRPLRNEIIDIVDQALPAVPAKRKATLLVIKRALSEAPCEGICLA